MYRKVVSVPIILTILLAGCATKYTVLDSSKGVSTIKLAPVSGTLPKASVTNLWSVDDQFVCGKRSNSLKKMVALVRGQAGTNLNPEGLEVESSQNFRMHFSSTVVKGLSSIYSADTASCYVTFSFEPKPNKSYSVLFDNDGAGRCNIKVVDDESPNVALTLSELSDRCL